MDVATDDLAFIVIPINDLSNALLMNNKIILYTYSSFTFSLMMNEYGITIFF